MLILTEPQVRQCLRIASCISSNRIALGSIRSDIITGSFVPPRIGLPYGPSSIKLVTSVENGGTKNEAEDGEGMTQDWTLFKPAAYYPPSPTHSNTLMGLKVISMRAENASHGLPIAPATITLLDANNGEVSTVMGGTYLTAARTAAGSAIATEYVWREKKKRGKGNITKPKVVVFGAGLQAEMHVKCLQHVMSNIGSITIINRTLDRAESLKKTLDGENERNRLGKDEIIEKINCIALSNTTSVRSTVQTADIILTCTNSSKPLFPGDWVRPGTHISGIGSYTPKMEEISADFVRDRCRVVVDTPGAFDAGDLKWITMQSKNYVGLLGDLMNEEKSKEGIALGKNAEELDCTFYKAVGTAIQDLFTAQTVLENAKEMGVGTEIKMS